MVTGWKSPHNVPADASACVCVRHLLISRAVLLAQNFYTHRSTILCCVVRVPATSVLPVTPPLLHFITRARIRVRVGGLTGGPTIPCDTGQLESIHAVVWQLFHTFHPSVDNNDLPYHMVAFSLWVISRRDDQLQVSLNHLR